MSVYEGALQIFQAYKSKLNEYYPDMIEGGIAVVEQKRGSTYKYAITMIQGKILSKEIVNNLVNLRKDIGYLILEKMNQYRRKNNLNSLQWSEKAYDRALEHTYY